MEVDDLKKNSVNYRKISKICVNVEYENSILSELSITPDLAILELETRFPNMKDFFSPLMSQTNSFYPQEKSSESGILSFKFLINCKCFVHLLFVCLYSEQKMYKNHTVSSQIFCLLSLPVLFLRRVSLQPTYSQFFCEISMFSSRLLWFNNLFHTT